MNKRRGGCYHGAIGHFDEVIFGAGENRLRGGRWGGGGRCRQRNETPHLIGYNNSFVMIFMSGGAVLCLSTMQYSPRRIAIRYGRGRAGCLLRRGTPWCPPGWCPISARQSKLIAHHSDISALFLKHIFRCLGLWPASRLLYSRSKSPAMVQNRAYSLWFDKYDLFQQF